jgi:hypothetical protein
MSEKDYSTQRAEFSIPTLTVHRCRSMIYGTPVAGGARERRLEYWTTPGALLPLRPCLARPDGFEPPTTWFEGPHSFTRKSMIFHSSRYSNRLIFPLDTSP